MLRRALILSSPAALLTACGPQQSTTPATSPGGSTQPTTGKPTPGGTLNVVMSRDATNFDPLRTNDVYSSSVMNLVADTLYEINPKGEVVGRLVEKTDNPSANVYV